MSIGAEIPYGGYWSTPFCRWQGDFKNLHALSFASHVLRDELRERDWSKNVFDFMVLGNTIPQQHSFYGAPWVATLGGLEGVSGPTVSQACASGIRSIVSAVGEIEMGLATSALVVTADRTSNGPHLYYPDPEGVGGGGKSEKWVLDNFSYDPNGGHSMLATAENVALRHGISMSQQHDVAVMRSEQYQLSLRDDCSFQKRYMRLPFNIPNSRFSKVVGAIGTDVGVRLSTHKSVAGLEPVVKNGSVTYAGQTHPADGNASIVVASPEKCKELSKDENIRIKILGFGQARVGRAYMPEAVVPAASMALKMAGLSITEIDAVKTHNPFAVNDILFSRDTGFPLERMNNFGCSLIWGHPQGPTGTRSLIELIEELVERGGGTGLFSGCAAGDSGMAMCVAVDSG